MFISDETLRVIHLVARHQSITTAAEQLNKANIAKLFLATWKH